MITIIVCLYFLIITLFALLVRKNKNNSNYFLGNNLGILMCVAIGAGEWMGGTSTTGVAEYGYKYGISGAWYTIANGIGIFVLATFFSKMFRRTGYKTVSGIIGSYLGERARVVSGALILITLFAVGASQMTALGALCKTLFGTSMNVSILIAGLFVVIYTGIGGSEVIAKTNLIHIIVLIVGMAVSLFLKLSELGISRLTLELPSSFFSFDAIGLPKVFSWIIASVLGACTAQAGIQPILCARDEKVAARSSYIIALIVAPFGILTVLLGIIAKIYYPNLENPKLALPLLLTSNNPIISSIMLIALLSAIISTASPIILSCGTIIVKDILPKCINIDEKEEKTKIFATKLVTFLSGFLCVFITIMLASGSMILDIVYFAYSIRGSLFIILLMGMFNKKLSERDSIVSMIITAVVSIFWIIYKGVLGHYPIHPEFTETYISLIIAIASSTILSLLGETNEDNRRVCKEVGNGDA